MRHAIHRSAFHALAVTAAAFAVAGPARAQEDQTRTYRVILFLAQEGAPAEISLRRLDEVWTEGESVDRLRRLLSVSQIERLEDVTILPGRETPALRLGNVTVRVKGAYREPRRDAMVLRVEVDGGREAFVKEIVTKGFGETISVVYPLAEGDRSIVALIVPVPVQ